MYIQDLITLYGAETDYHTLNKSNILFSSPLQIVLACIPVSTSYKPVSHLPPSPNGRCQVHIFTGLAQSRGTHIIVKDCHLLQEFKTIERAPLRPWSKWTANSDKKLNVNKPCVTSRKTAFRLQKRHLAGTCIVHISPCKFSKCFTKFFKI